MPLAPPNAYRPGTRLTVGSHDVSIIKYISEGGFAHVYTCKIDPTYNGSDVACLKRVVVPTKMQLNLLRQEVDAMKRLKGNKHIVSYIDSHASRLHETMAYPDKPQQYEVFVLMEYCSNNGLIDYMNTRLVDRLQEPEILHIMHDVTIGVAMCHHLQPPLIHRDIKIENILIDSERVYKLCDFGSATGYLPAPKSPQELKLLHDDLMQNTTPQYRSPEMIDLSHGFPIDDKSDIWALGCFLYKLCYYTTPFESPNQKSLSDMELSILNCDKTLHFPPNQNGRQISSRLKNIIRCCLRPDPRRRPNALQLLEEICTMSGIHKIPNVIPYTVLHTKANGKLKQLADATNTGISYSPTRSRDSLPALSKTAIAIKNENAKPTDPFASIDKSKILSSTNTRDSKNASLPLSKIKSSTIPSRDTSTADDQVFAEGSLGSYYNRSHAQSVSSLHDYIRSQIHEGPSEVGIGDYADSDNDTLQFLKSKEEEAYKKSNTSRQNTGGSFRHSLMHNLSRISTGGSLSSISGNHTGSNGSDSKKNKIKGFSSVKRLLSSQSKRLPSNSEEKSNQEHDLGKSDSTGLSEKSRKRLSIQGRMALLMNNTKEEHVRKTAKGYGKYTDSDLKDEDDIDAINAQSDIEDNARNRNRVEVTRSSKRPSPPEVPFRLSSKAEHKPSTPTKNLKPLKSHTKEKPLIINKSAPPKPPKPSKPGHLKSPAKEKTMSSAQDMDSFSIPNLDDLEKQFSKRFPSYV